MISRLKISIIVLLTISVLKIFADENCKFDPFRYHCHNISESEWIENIEKADTRFIKCTNCTLETLPLQKLQLITRQKLKTLTVENVTNVIKIDENTFKDCMNLEDIELHNLSIEEIRPEYLAPLEDVEDLVFINVNITIQNNDTFKFVPNLEKLRISGAKLDYFGSETIQYLTELEIFDVSDNDIAIIAPNTFENNRKLKSIYLYKNYLTTLPPNLFDNLKKLKLVDLSDNPLVTFDLAHIITVNRKLKYFYLYDIPCPTFERLKYDGEKCPISKNITTTINELNKKDEIFHVIYEKIDTKCDVFCVSQNRLDSFPENDLYKILYYKEIGVEN